MEAKLIRSFRDGTLLVTINGKPEIVTQQRWEAIQNGRIVEPKVSKIGEGLTDDPDDPDLGRGGNVERSPQNKKYLVLSDEERSKGYVRPVRDTYVHDTCGTSTSMGSAIAETYARDPKFYGFTYCVHCSKHLPVSEFKWKDGSTVGS